MTYVESTLSAGEKVLHWGKVSWWSQWFKILLAVAFGLSAFGPAARSGQGSPGFPILVALIFVAWAWAVFTTTELAVTNKRIVAKFGILRRRTIELRLQKLETVQVNQSMMGRWLDYGNVVIAGAGTPQTPVPHISSPTAFSKAAMDAAQSHQVDDQPTPSRASSPQVAASPMATSPKQADRANFAEEFTKLAKLRDEGVLSDAEFAEMKAALIHRAKDRPATG